MTLFIAAPVLPIRYRGLVALLGESDQLAKQIGFTDVLSEPFSQFGKGRELR
jgi:hypothetical protein